MKSAIVSETFKPAAARVEQPVLAWGNGLGLRITAPVARAARLGRGSVISMEVVEEGILIRAVDRPRRLTLEQKLKAFDPRRHGGEVMASGRKGAEIF
jgi:antitoxin MazE